MKMNEYLTALQTHLNTQQSPNQNLLDLLYDAYNDTTGMDNAAMHNAPRLSFLLLYTK